MFFRIFGVAMALTLDSIVIPRRGSESAFPAAAMLQPVLECHSRPVPGHKEDILAIEALIITLIIGAAAGWLAGQIVKGYGYGLVGNIVIGIVGAVIAGFILPRAGVALGGGIVGAIISATIGAVILLLLIRVIKRT